MRHLYGIALAIALTLVMFFAGGWGYLRLLRLPAPPGQVSALPANGGSLLSNGMMLLALAALIATAVLAGLLALLPSVSPLAPGLPGLLLLAWTALYLVGVRSAVDLIPLRAHAFGAGWEGLLVNGVLGAGGAALILPMFLPSRWRQPRRAGHTASVPSARAVDDFLTSVRSEADSRQEEPALVGTVMGGPPSGLVAPVDTTRVTGASRALRATGSFPASTGGMSPTVAGMPRRPTGNMPRITGSIPRIPRNDPRRTGPFRPAGPFHGIADTSLLGRPYAPDRDPDN